MKCHNCEADLPDNAQACPWCGTEFFAPDAPATSPEQAVPPIHEAPSPVAQPAYQDSPPVVQPTYQDPPQVARPAAPLNRKSKNWILWVAIAVVVVIVVCCICWFGMGFLSVLGDGGYY